MTNLHDFADWLSPVVVKELRQGMRARAFILSFLAVQAAMLCVVLSSLALVARNPGSGDSLTALFWIIVGVPVLLIMPLSALGGISAEKRGNTLELMFLTKLSSRRIVLGKWLAVLLQALLLICAVLPYVVLRYFLGGINLGAELMVLGGMLLLSALFSACALALSPLPALASRILVGFGCIFLLWFGLLGYVVRMGFGAAAAVSLPSSVAWGPWLLTAASFVLLVAIPLEFAASQIAAPSENHSTILRLEVLLLLGVGAVQAVLYGTSSALLLVPGALLCGVAVVGFLSEQTKTCERIYEPFVKRGGLGRLLGRLLYPGWATAVYYSLVAGLISALISFSTRFTPAAADQLVVIWVLSLGSLHLSFALIRAFKPLARQPFIWFWLLQIFTYVLHAVFSEVVPGGGKITGSLPTIALGNVVGDLSGRRPAEHHAALWLSVASIVASILLAWRDFRAIRAAEERAAETLRQARAAELPAQAQAA